MFNYTPLAADRSKRERTLLSTIESAYWPRETTEALRG